MEHTETGFSALSAAYLEATEFFDFEKPVVRDFAADAADGAEGAVETAMRLYYAVRDRIRYDPYTIRIERETYRASTVVTEGTAFCLPKANLLVACARARGIPAAIGLADVINHLCTPRLRHLMGGKELFVDHGYAALYLDGRWVKAAPAFNIELCRRFGVRATEFDGRSHALFQPYDAEGRRHMEYVADHGVFSDFPYDRVVRDFADYYPPAVIHPEARAAALAAFDEHCARRFEEETPLR